MDETQMCLLEKAWHFYKLGQLLDAHEIMASIGYSTREAELILANYTVQVHKIRLTGTYN